jgi:hypothetical protein
MIESVAHWQPTCKTRTVPPRSIGSDIGCRIDDDREIGVRQALVRRQRYQNDHRVRWSKQFVILDYNCWAEFVRLGGDRVTPPVGQNDLAGDKLSHSNGRNPTTCPNPRRIPVPRRRMRCGGPRLHWRRGYARAGAGLPQPPRAGAGRKTTQFPASAPPRPELRAPPHPGERTTGRSWRDRHFWCSTVL